MYVQCEAWTGPGAPSTDPCHVGLALSCEARQKPCVKSGLLCTLLDTTFILSMHRLFLSRHASTFSTLIFFSFPTPTSIDTHSPPSVKTLD